MKYSSFSKLDSGLLVLSSAGGLWTTLSGIAAVVVYFYQKNHVIK